MRYMKNCETSCNYICKYIGRETKTRWKNTLESMIFPWRGSMCALHHRGLLEPSYYKWTSWESFNKKHLSVYSYSQQLYGPVTRLIPRENICPMTAFPPLGEVHTLRNEEDIFQRRKEEGREKRTGWPLDDLKSVQYFILFLCMIFSFFLVVDVNCG